MRRWTPVQTQIFLSLLDGWAIYLRFGKYLLQRRTTPDDHQGWHEYESRLTVNHSTKHTLWAGGYIEQKERGQPYTLTDLGRREAMKLKQKEHYVGNNQNVESHVNG